MKNLLKNYLFITIFAIIVAFAGVVNADNDIANNTATNTVDNNTTSNTSKNTTNNTTDNTTKTTTKSSNANLSTMGVSPKEYDFTGFNKNKTSYSVTVPNDINSLKVAYKTEHAKAKVVITGNNNLEVGSNTIKVVVTAEDGKTKKTYTIKVTKLAAEDNKPGNLIDDEDDTTSLYLSSLSIKGLEITPEFKNNVYSYEATIDMDTNDLSKVDVEAKSSNKNATVEVTGNTDLQEGENVINVIVKSKTTSDQTVYQITVNKVSKASEVASSGNHIKKEHIIIGLFIVAAIIAVIIIIKMNKGGRGKEEYDYDDDFEDNNINNNTNDNFIEDLYKRRNDGQRLNKFEEDTIEDIEKENDRIFNKPKKGEIYDYDKETGNYDSNDNNDDFLDELSKKSKGRHF